MAEPSWGTLFAVIRDAVIRWLPGLLLRGYPPSVVAENVAVQIEHLRFSGITHNAPASVALYVRYINFNPFAMLVEFISVDVAVGHNPIADMQRRDPHRIGPRQALPPIRYGRSGFNDPRIYYELKIEGSRAEWLRNQLRSPSGPGIGVNLKVSISGQGPTGEWRRDDLELYFAGETVSGLG